MDQQAAGSQVSRPRSYTEEYKRQVVDPVVSTGRTASVAAELGIHHTLLSRWVRRYGQLAGSAATAPAAPRSAMASSLKPVPVPHADQAAEPDAEHPSGIGRLRRENERLRMERHILKNCRGHDCYPRAIRTELGKVVRHRTSRYLRNRLEQDHRGLNLHLLGRIAVAAPPGRGADAACPTPFARLRQRRNTDGSRPNSVAICGNGRPLSRSRTIALRLNPSVNSRHVFVVVICTSAPGGAYTNRLKF